MLAPDQAVLCLQRSIVNYVQVTGDECVPAGEKTWTACTATLRTSLTSEEGSILMESEQEADMQDFESDRELELENVTPPRYIYDPFNSPEHLNNRGPVVRCYDGKGLIASEGYTSPTWVDGCLWEYEGGGISFVYMTSPHVVLNFSRCEVSL